MSIQEVSEGARDIGFVSGVLSGIELTVNLLPSQREAVAMAREAVSRIEGRHQAAVLAFSFSNQPKV